MKKIFVVALITFCLAQTASAQVFKKGDFLLDAGLSLSSPLIPYGGIEYGITDKIGPGYIGVGGTGYFWLGSGYTGLTFGPFARYHFDIPSQKDLDVFGGLGFYFGSVLSGDYGTGTFGPYFGWQAGARYYFQPKLAAHVILGGAGYVGLGVGITLRF